MINLQLSTSDHNYNFAIDMKLSTKSQVWIFSCKFNRIGGKGYEISSEFVLTYLRKTQHLTLFELVLKTTT